MMHLARLDILGCPIDPLSAEAIVACAVEAMRKQAPCIIEGLNVAKLIDARRDDALYAALSAAHIVHADGAGIALAAKVLGLPLPTRRAGIDLMDDLLAACVREGASVFLLGAREEVVCRAAAVMQQRHTGLAVAGTHHGYFTPQEALDVAAQIKASGARLLLIGISSPKKEIFLHAHLAACGAPVAMGVGGAFDVVAGDIKRAPRWMQRAGLEWSFRLWQEPRRLFWRYLRTNSVFAWLLLRAWIMRPHPAAGLSWHRFREQMEQYAPSAGNYCPHSVYFLHQRRPFGGRAHAIAAALRDVFLLLRQPDAAPPATPETLYAAVSLPGPSGEGAMQLAMDALPQKPMVVAHPRVKHGAMLRPARIRLPQVIAALRSTPRYIAQPRGAASRVILWSVALRYRLWRSSWQSFIAAHPSMRYMLLHNDIDLMNQSLIEALPTAVTSVCIQHGVPTDEFFPTRAHISVVWGSTSRAVYEASGSSSQLVEDAPPRSRTGTHGDGGAPTSIALISQTHTPVYGVPLAPLFDALARQLVASTVPCAILLHPGEVKRCRAYGGLSAYMHKPPHRALQQSAPRLLVVGYSSTALIDAAIAGHLVVALDWPVHASHGAHRIGCPPTRCVDAEAVLALFRQLQTDPQARSAMQDRQQAWLAETFNESQQLRHYVG